MAGPSNWVQSPYHNPLRLNGVYVHETGIIPLERQPSPGASVIPMADGGTVYQVPLHDLLGKKPSIVSYYRWPLQVQADDEEGWYLLIGVSKRGRSVELIDFAYEVDVFEAGLSTTSFTLPRPTAESQWAAFPTVDYPTRAFVDGVEQTVVSAAPSAGEVQIVARAVTTPALSNGSVLEIRYVPSYQVILPVPLTRINRFSDMTITVDLVEVCSP